MNTITCYAIESYNLKGERCLWDMSAEDWVTEQSDDSNTFLGENKDFAESVLRDAYQRQFQMTTPKLITYSR